MTASLSLNRIGGDATGFSVLIAWSGPEDKPFYRALLVSQTCAGLIGSEAFWGYAVINVEELDRVLSVLEAHQRTLKDGPHVATDIGYFVEVQTDGQVRHCPLGFNQTTLDILNDMANALEVSKRKPVIDIVNRMGSVHKHAVD